MASKRHPNLPPRNPYLADSLYPIAHGSSAQQDNTDAAGPTGPTMQLGPDQIDYAPVGPGHFGMCISSPYPDGRRVIWSNGADRIVKLDHDTLEVLATHELPDTKVWTNQEAEETIAKLEVPDQSQRVAAAIEIAMATLTNLAGVYTLLDRDGNLYVGSSTGVTTYGDAVEGDPDSGIVVRRAWEPPEEVTGPLVGMNMTFDGRITLATEHGYVIALKRDFSDYDVVKMHHSEGAAEYSDRMTGGMGWVRTSHAVDEMGGIYLNSNSHVHRVVWTGQRLSLDEPDGAWTAPIRNSLGCGSGSTPSLMGFGDEDKFVVITDGDELMNLTLVWREDIPDDWGQLSGAPSRRIAGFLPANMGDPNRTAIQSDQSVNIYGYGAVVVNNEPPTVPESFLASGKGARLLAGFVATDPEFTPHGVQKFEWDPEARQLKYAWANTEVSSPNCVPHISVQSNMVYTCGVRDGQWTLEALDYATGESAFHWIVGGERYNTVYAGVLLDQEGRIVWGSMFGKVRLNP